MEERWQFSISLNSTGISCSNEVEAYALCQASKKAMQTADEVQTTESY